MARAGKYQYRSYHTTASAWCSGCTASGPKTGDKTHAAQLAREAGWYVGTCFLCPTCRKNAELLAAVKAAGRR